MQQARFQFILQMIFVHVVGHTGYRAFGDGFKKACSFLNEVLTAASKLKLSEVMPYHVDDLAILRGELATYLVLTLQQEALDVLRTALVARGLDPTLLEDVKVQPDEELETEFKKHGTATIARLMN